MDSTVRDHLKQEQQALEAEIREAFNGVTREGGVSWSETAVVDRYGSDDDRQNARRSDSDTSWTEFVDNERWRPFAGIGGFAFLDAIGFRYYLPAAMIRGVRIGSDQGIELHLKAVRQGKKPDDRDMHQFSLLDERQRKCIARYLRFIVAWAEAHEWWVEAEHAQRALDSYWADWADAG